MSRCPTLSCILIALLSMPAGAVLVDFNGPAYVDDTLPAQVDPEHGAWTTTTGTGFINVENTPTDGRVVILPNAGGNDRDAELNFDMPVRPGPDNKIIAFFDFIESVEGADSGFIWKMMFRDADGNDLARVDGQKNLIRGRGPGGTGMVTANMTVGGADPMVRTLFIDIDTSGLGGNASFYQDTIDPANLLGSLAYDTPNDEVARITIETFTRDDLSDNRGRIDNIGVFAMPGLNCDFDGSTVCDITDLNALLAAVGTDGGTFDLDQSGMVDSVDIAQWLNEAGTVNIGVPYVMGDADLDGDVDAADLNLLGISWQSTVNLRWDNGNFNGDSIVNAADLNVLGINWQSGVGAAAVPEPNMLALLFAAALASTAKRRPFSTGGHRKR